MTRLIEILMFLLPFLGFVAWRVLSPSGGVPAWLVAGSVGFVVLMLAALFALRQLDASDGARAYVPARLEGDRVLPGHAAPP